MLFDIDYWVSESALHSRNLQFTHTYLHCIVWHTYELQKWRSLSWETKFREVESFPCRCTVIVQLVGKTPREVTFSYKKLQRREISPTKCAEKNSLWWKLTTLLIETCGKPAEELSRLCDEFKTNACKRCQPDWRSIVHQTTNQRQSLQLDVAMQRKRQPWQFVLAYWMHASIALLFTSRSVHLSQHEGERHKVHSFTS